MELFYTQDIEMRHALSEEESMHCIKVLRHDRGDEIYITDGSGNIYTARITNPHPKHCELEILTKQQQEKNHHFHLHIAIAPTKNIERLEWMIEKCTEIGIDQITPLLCRFSERKQIREDRLEKIILSACKQSLNTYFPKLNPLTSFSDFINAQREETRYIAHCYKDERYELATVIQPVKSCVIMIGPEGDFSEQEVRQAIDKGFKPVSLGNSRLRTETAGVVACHTAILINQINQHTAVK